MPIHDLKEQIARLPEQPGVYLWVNRSGDTIYVGKARSLRDRVRSYLAAAGMSPRHDALLDEITSVDVIVTDSVMEALALENNLIKERSPKYNILLRDDKNYPFLQLTTSEDFPRMLVARRVERNGDFYAGPFLPAKIARRTMGLAHRLFGIRSCNEVITGARGRPCLEYDIKRCIAPCVREICTQEQYGVAVANARLLLEGRNDELIDTLRDRMVGASEEQRFEEAAQLRDALRTVQILRDRQQKVATAQLGDRDVFGLKVGPSGSVIQVFAMRGGRIVERLELVADPGGIAGRDADVLQATLQQFYEMRVAPAEIDLPLDVVSMQFDASFQIGSIRARPASPTVAIEIPALAARTALPLETAFRLGPVDLDNAARISIVRLAPTAQRFQAVATHAAFEIGGVTVVPANERERLQLMSAATSTMTMQLLAPLELESVEFSANLEVRQLVLRCRSRAVRVTLNSESSPTRSGANFETTMVKLDDSRRISELTLAPVS